MPIGPSALYKKERRLKPPLFFGNLVDGRRLELPTSALRWRPTPGYLLRIKMAAPRASVASLTRLLPEAYSVVDLL
jgi:hypothetical protein